MSSHDCRVEGDIQLKECVTKDQIKAALQRFLGHHCISFERLERNDEIEHDEGGDRLRLSIRVSGYGGFKNEEADDLAIDLEEVAAADQYFEFFDDDTGDDDARCTPYFIGDDRKARLEYGIRAMEDWVKPVIGEAQYAELVEKVRALPLLDRVR